MINARRSSALMLLITLLLITLLLSLNGCKEEEETMLFQAENYCLFSAMKGTLTFEGKPAVGAKVVRHIEVDKKEPPDFVITDEEGRFSFDTINRKIRQPFLTEFVVSQDIFVHYQGQEYHIWHLSKVGKMSEYEEFGGKLVNLRCEITDEMVAVETRALLGTSCVWDGMPLTTEF